MSSKLPLLCIVARIIGLCNAGPIFWMEKKNLLPEAGRYYPTLGFITSSFMYGTMFKMNKSSSSSSSNPMNFTATEYFSDPDLLSSTGFEIDFERNILYICHSAPNLFYTVMYSGSPPPPSNWSAEYGFMSGVMIVDLNTMQKIADFDLQDLDDSIYHLANDIVLDSDGNAYVSDSMGGVVWQIARNDSLYVLDEFSSTDRWQQRDASGAKSEVFFDGLQLDRNSESFLLLNAWIQGTSVMFKVGMNDSMNPYQVNYTNVLSIQYGFDGQIFSDDGKYLYVTGDATNVVYQFESNDNWDSLTLKQSLPTQQPTPTAIAIATDGMFGTGKTETVYVYCALGFASNNVTFWPVELLDFTRNSTVIVNNTNCHDHDHGGKDSDEQNRNMIIIYSLAAVCVLLFIGFIIALVCCYRIKKRIAHFGSNLDYQNMGNNM